MPVGGDDPVLRYPYLLRQDELIDDLARPTAGGPVFGPYKTFQVAVVDVEQLTGLDFGALRDRDAFVRTGRRGRVELTSPTDVVVE